MMKKKANTSSDVSDFPAAVRVWDLPIRLFHWLLVALVAASFVTVKVGGNAMQYHEYSGMAILALLMFRAVWGFVGSQPARFTDFVKGPAEVWRYSTALLKNGSPRFLGHNPLGGWSVLAMLLVLFFQVCTGLFANDDIVTEGPLYLWVSKPTSDWLTRIHKFNANVIMVLTGIHLLAVLFHFFVKRENLLKPMITGIKHRTGNHTEPFMAPIWLAALIAVASGCGVYLLFY